MRLPRSFRPAASFGPAACVAACVAAGVLGVAVSGPAAGAAPATRAATGESGVHGQSLSLDGGALLVRPTPTAPRVHRTWAQFDLTHSDAGGAGFATGRVLYGAVTITARRVPDPDLPGRLPSFHKTPAWVLFYSPGAASCPAGLGRDEGGPLPTSASRQSVMVIDARTGQALVYLGAGAQPCTPNTRPLVQKVAEELSVPWSGANLPAGTPITTVTAHYPGCSTDFVTGASEKPGTPSVLGVVAYHAFGPCDRNPRDVADSIADFHLVAPVRHARVGPVTTGKPAF